MEIVLVIDSLGFGGAERQLVELVKGLAARGHRLHVVSLMKVPNGYAEILEGLGVFPVYFERAHKYGLLKPFSSLLKYLKSHPVDVVHAFMSYGGLMGVLAAKLAGIPVVCSAIRDAKDANLRVKCSIRLLAMLSDILVANSFAGFHNRFSGMEPHFRVVYNGLDFGRFEAVEAAPGSLRQELGITGLHPMIGMVASFSPYKDHTSLLESLPLLIQSFRDIGLLLIGDGQDRSKVRRKASEMGLGSRVSLPSHRKDVDAIYSLLDVCVLLGNPGIILEGIPNVLLEAMAAGLPVIASRGGGVDELVSDGVNGILVSPNSPEQVSRALMRILKDGELAASLGRAGRNHVRERFALSRYVEEYESLYQQLMDKKSDRNSLTTKGVRLEKNQDALRSEGL